jgi:hypothetical protein
VPQLLLLRLLLVERLLLQPLGRLEHRIEALLLLL